MIAAITTALGTVISWVGTVIGALLDTDGDLAALLPCLAIFCAVSALFMGIKAIRGFIWGA